MLEREPIHKQLMQDVENEFVSKEGQSLNSIKVEIVSEYRRRVSAYLGEDVPAFTDEGVYITSQEQARRDQFRKKMQSSGRLPKPDNK